jgi:hypothetical protein
MLNMKRYCLVNGKEVTNVGDLPVNYENISNFNLLSDDKLIKYKWFPIEEVNYNKEVFVGIRYFIYKDHVKELTETRDKTIEEINSDNEKSI